MVAKFLIIAVLVAAVQGIEIRNDYPSHSSFGSFGSDISNQFGEIKSPQEVYLGDRERVQYFLHDSDGTKYSFNYPTLNALNEKEIQKDPILGYTAPTVNPPIATPFTNGLYAQFGQSYSNGYATPIPHGYLGLPNYGHAEPLTEEQVLSYRHRAQLIHGFANGQTASLAGGYATPYNYGYSTTLAPGQIAELGHRYPSLQSHRYTRSQVASQRYPASHNYGYPARAQRYRRSHYKRRSPQLHHSW